MDCTNFKPVSSGWTIYRSRKDDANGIFGFSSDRRVVHRGCRVYECSCGARSEVLRNGNDLRRWWRKHKGKMKAKEMV